MSAETQGPDAATMSKYEATLRHFTTRPLDVDRIQVFHDGRFDTVWVASVGGRILATVDEPYRFGTAPEAREYGERVREKMRSALAEEERKRLILAMAGPAPPAWINGEPVNLAAAVEDALRKFGTPTGPRAPGE